MSKKRHNRKSSWKKWVAAAISATVLGTGALTIKNIPYYLGETVTEVVDGDTFFIKNRQPIRLYGVNAPALEHCLGREAKLALTKLISGKRIILREPLSDGRGRVMALVYTDNRLINEVMIRAGLVQYKRQGGPESARMKTASDYARKNKIGIYSPSCYQSQPPNPKCAIKGNWDEQQNKKYFFTPSCNFYSLVIIEKHQGDDWFCTENEAIKAGFIKSPNCTD